MTRPGSSPSRGRHAAPDDDARPEEVRPAGRHAAPDPPSRRPAPPDPSHPAARDRNGYPAPAPNGPAASPGHSGYPGPARNGPAASPGHSGYSAPGPNGHPAPGPNGHPAPGPNGHPAPGHSGYRAPRPNGPAAPERKGYPAPGPNDHPGPGRSGYPVPGPNRDPAPRRSRRPEPPPDRPDQPRPRRHAAPDDAGPEAGHAWPAQPPNTAYHRPRPAAPYRSPEPGVHRHPGPLPTGHAGPEAGPARPETSGYAGADPGADPVAYRRPEPAGGYAGPEVAGYARPGQGYVGPEPDGFEPGGRAGRHPWPEVNGRHLESPAPPAVNGYRLDQPVAPVTGFPYTPAPSAPIAYPVNGHGVDAAEREAASWPVDGRAAELDRPDPQIAVVPLDDETTQVLRRPTEAARPTPTPTDRPATALPAKPAHPPRAVVRRRAARRKALEWPFLIVFALVSAFLIRQYVVQTFYIPSASMHETLLEGDRVLVNKVGYHLHDVHRGDVVVFRKPPNLDVSEDDLIKRVVALPGETVAGHGGKVYVNGAPLDESYVEPLCHGTGDFAKVTVPAGTLWVMGDNRCNSSDSRIFGPIDQKLVVGRAFVRVWPFDRLSGL